MCALEIDISCRAVYVCSTDALVDHIHELANNVITERAREDGVQLDGVSTGTTMRGSVLYPTAAADLKRLLPCIRHRIVDMWCEATHKFEPDPKKVGQIIRAAGLARSGAARGDGSRGAGLLDSWHVNLTACRTCISETEVMRLLLGIKAGKRPGTSGVCGEAYKRAAVILAPAFLESYGQLKDPELVFAFSPQHICETLWSLAAKKQGANTIDAVRYL